MHKSIELLEKYCERIEKELHDLYKKVEKSETMPPTDLDIMDKLLHSMKSVKTVLAMLEYQDDDEDDGYSGRYYSEPTYARRYSGRGYSGRDNYGGGDYSGRRMNRGYSRDSEKSDMIRKLEDMMNRVRTEDEAIAIQDTLNMLNKY